MSELFNNISSWITYGFDKVKGNYKPDGDLSTAGEVYLGKNGAQGILLCMHSSKDIKDISIELTNSSASDISYDMYRVCYVTKEGDDNKYADPMLDYQEGSKLDIIAGETLSIYIEFKTSKETVAGKYGYTFAAKSLSGEEIAVYEVFVTVWKFAYSDTPALDTAIGVWKSKISDWYGFCSEDNYKQFYDYMLDHKMSAYDLPYDILDPRADEYMSDPRVTTFCVRWTGEIDEEKIDKIYEKLQTNPEWLKKAYIYILDEPRTQEHLDHIASRFPHYKEKWPELRICTPFYTNLKVSDTEDQLDHLSKYVDLLCPKLNMFGTEAKFPNYYERLMAIRESGNKVWTYVCNYPQEPYSNVHIDMSGLVNRLVFWQSYQYSADGFLYYCAVNWQYFNDYTGDVWKDGGAVYECWGDGVLLYPGFSTKFIYDFKRIAPYASIRLKIVRDGIDDYDMLKMAEELFGRDWVISKINEITPDLTTVSVNDDGFNAIRVAIGNAISEAQN